MNCIKNLSAVVLTITPLAAMAVPRPAMDGHFPNDDAPGPLILAASGATNPPKSSAKPQQGVTEEELRMMLQQRSRGFGGIFGPMIQGLKQGGGKARSSGKDCGPYTDYAACQAYKAGDGWAAERLQNRRSTPSERDWYDR